jgi:hypothetical protein
MAAIISGDVVGEVPMEWEAIVPSDTSDPLERAKAITILSHLRDNPDTVRSMFDQGWDKRRGNAGARRIVRECIPLLKRMQQQHALDHGDLAATADIDGTIKRFHRERQTAVSMRKRQESAKRYAKQLRQELAKLETIQERVERLISETSGQLTRHQDEVLRCDTQSSKAERKLRELKSTMTQIVLVLIRKVAGIAVEIEGAEEAGQGAPGEEEEEEWTGYHHRGENRRPLMDLNPEGVDRDEEFKLESMERMKRFNERASLYRRIDEKKKQGGSLSKIERDVRRRGKPTLEQDDLVLWTKLHGAVKRYHGVRVPVLMLEPDGEEDAPSGTCWWERFVGFYNTALETPFNLRDHGKAEKILEELETKMIEEAYYPDGRSCDDDDDDDDDDREDVVMTEEHVESVEQRVVGKIKAMLDRGDFDERTAEKVRHLMSQDAAPDSIYDVFLSGSGSVVMAPQPTSRGCDDTTDDGMPDSPPSGGTTDTTTATTTIATVSESSGNNGGRRSGGAAKEKKPTLSGGDPWSVKLSKALEAGRISKLDAEVLRQFCSRYERSLWAPICATEGGEERRDPSLVDREDFMEFFTWLATQVTILVKTVTNEKNRAFLLQTNKRVGEDPPSPEDGGDFLPDVHARIRRYDTFLRFFTDMTHMRGPGLSQSEGGATAAPPVKVNEGSKGNVVPQGNVILADHWLRDWRFCTLAQALSADNPQMMYNLIDPPDYTIGGWACIRCMEKLPYRRGDCECRCFRGHRRSECMNRGSGCYGFHPNRAMEYLILGIPRMDLEYIEQQQQQRQREEGRSRNGRVRNRMVKTASNPHAYHYRRWTFRQRWYAFRKEMKRIVCGHVTWCGVVPEEERDIFYEGLVTDVGAVVRDWVENFDWDHYGPPIYGPKTMKARCEWAARTHLDILCDESKHDPSRKAAQLTHNRGPNWRWIADGCPICTFLYEANACNVGRGLCNGCRSWGLIAGPANRLINTDPAYAALRSHSGGRGFSKRKRHAITNNIGLIPPDTAAKRRREREPSPVNVFDWWNLVAAYPFMSELQQQHPAARSGDDSHQAQQNPRETTNIFALWSGFDNGGGFAAAEDGVVNAAVAAAECGAQTLGATRKPISSSNNEMMHL